MSKEIINHTESFEDRYPNINGWVKDGLIEIGYSDYSKSFVRALDEGGLIWEGSRKYDSLDDALKDLDTGIAAFVKEQGI